MQKTDLVSGCTGLALSLAVCQGALAMPMGTRANPGPAFVPFWVGIALAIMSLALVVRALVDRVRDRERAHGAHERVRVAGMVCGLLVYALTLSTLGYLVTTFLLLAVLVRLLGQRGWWVVAGFAAIATAGSYALFGLWLGVPLPGGILAR